MKKQRIVLYSSLFLFSLLLVFSSCKKINEATTLGGDLIPAVDNINTFEAFLDVKTTNKFFTDSTKLSFTQNVALGYLNDPKFGSTQADVYFNVAPALNNFYPFFHKDSALVIDSVVLSLAYTSFYGDTDALQTVKVYEIAQSSLFKDTAQYRFDHQPDFATTGTELGSRTFAIKTLNDSLKIIRDDTVRTANVLRIPLLNSIGERFKTFDTTSGLLGGFKNDSMFYSLFRGLAVKSEAKGNALGYFNLRDQANTKLTVYFKVNRNGKRDTASADFFHLTNGQANIIKRTSSGSSYETNVASNGGEKVFIQSTPGMKGSYGGIKIPGLDTFQNSIIHRAELIVSRIDTDGSQEKFFPIPASLYLDRKRVSNDSVFFFQKDVVELSGNLNPAFGGVLEADGKYHFNITRHVQDIITGREKNDSLRLFAPLQVSYRFPGSSIPFAIPVNSQVAYGRVIVGGGTHSDPALRMRMRIIYSKIK